MSQPMEKCSRSGIRGASLLLTIALAVAGCAAGSDAADDDVIRIGVAASLSGPNADAGTNLLHGYETWAESVNRSGGLLGNEVELVTYDDKSDPATAVRAYQRLIEQDQVDVTFGPYGSTTTFAVSQVTESAGIPLLATAAGAESIWEQDYGYVFQGEPGESLLARPPLDTAAALGLRRAAVLYPDNDWGSGFSKASEAIAPENGIDIVTSQAYPIDVADLSSVVLTAREADAEMIASAAYLPDSELIARALKDADWSPELVYLATARQSEFGEDLGADAEGITSYAFWHPDLKTPLNKEFQQLYKEMHDSEPSDHAAIGFSAGQILQAAIENTDGVDPDAIRDFLATAEVPTVLAGSYRVDDSGKQVGMDVLLVQWQDGKLVIVGPREYATHDLITPLPPWADR